MMDAQEKLFKLMKLDARMYRRKHVASLDPNDPKLKRNKNAHLIEPMRALWREGASRPEIAAALKISESRVAGIVFKYKFERGSVSEQAVPKPPTLPRVTPQPPQPKPATPKPMSEPESNPSGLPFPFMPPPPNNPLPKPSPPPQSPAV